MNQQDVKFLLFNEQNIVYTRIKGVYWIGLKSICEALKVNYNRQFQNLQTDPILGSAFAKQQMQVPGDNQKREYVCLPEEYIYGWIFSLRSDSPELLEYKRECYHLLYQHFHGVITRRMELYKELSSAKKKSVELEARLKSNPDFIEWEMNKMKTIRLWKNIKDTSDEDRDLFEDQ